MRIIHCVCSVVYSGRGDTTMPDFTRVIIIKDDGSVMIHSDEGIKPLNYMTAKPRVTYSTEIVDGLRVDSFENNNETLIITYKQIFSDINLHMETGDPGLTHDGTEKQLQEWLAYNLSDIVPHYDFVQREYETGNGPVDLLAFNRNTGKYVIIEVKRTATTNSFHQLKKYVEGVYDHEDLGEGVEKLLIALTVGDKAQDRARKLNYPWIELDKGIHGGYAFRECSENFDN